MEKNKIGIITYHFARNYGALLQCFALQQFLERNSYQVEIINAVSIQQEKNNSMYRKKNGIQKILYNIAILPFHNSRRKKERKFNTFIENYLNCSKLYRNGKELEKGTIGQYDFMISGSDQVWNPNNEDFDVMFFLPFPTSAKKIGYAISIGNATKKDLCKYAKWMKDFSCIGVREKSSMKIIEDFYEGQVYETIDPVLLLKKDEWVKIANQGKRIKSNYLLCYFLKKENFVEYYRYASNIAKQRKLKLIGINARYSFWSCMPYSDNSVGPKDFLSLIANAEMICTDSFHGTVFSTIFERNFCTLIPKKNTTDTRIEDYLNNIGLANSYTYLEELKELKHTNYKNVKEKMEKLVEDSKQLLRDELQ